MTIESDVCPGPLVFVESGGQEESNFSQGYFNRPEGLRIISILKQLLESGLEPDNIGIVMFFPPRHDS